MMVLQLLHFPDARLRTVAKLVKEVTPKIQYIIDQMIYTMYVKEGIGLAATQINFHYRIIVIDISGKKEKPLVLINPELISRSGEAAIEEGCLSIPIYRALVPRSAHIQVQALDRYGAPFELEANNLLAICIQHEIDHLLGRLFIDYISPLKRQRITKKLQKLYKTEDKNNFLQLVGK
ncbi:peptide deformylase [Candidatus Profftia tarda]|uniref:Peptide deformylase n=1 Tax=Candidatus Profftia tarda TaxID=1177216 RepID=A0A8E4H4A8_9ENTR|nr:peptide deformylase [Candidatus Profftia tarda]CAD6511997.1 Peptide deformylase [Candidatus Profftia tarda]